MSELKLPTEPVVVDKVNPVVHIIYGATKVGKTAALAELPDNLIIDLERGAETYECLRVKVDSYSRYLEVIRELQKPHKYQFVTIDTIDRLVEYVEKLVVYEWNEAQKKVKTPEYVKIYSEISYGKGYDLVRLKMREHIMDLRKLAPHVILVGHLKRTIIGDTNLEVKEDNLDLVGKLRNLICADADAVSFAFRGKDKEDEKPALKLSFKASENTAAGSRLSHLRGKIITLSKLVDEDKYETYWERIYTL